MAADDAALLAASRAGRVEAFGQLVERYQNLVCAVAYSKTGDRLLSEDIGQETFLAAWNKLETVREPDKLRPWLCSIARNLSGKAVRVRQRERLSHAEALDSNAGADPGPLAAAITKETEATVWQALEELPEAYREPLVLFYRENQSIKQVAVGLGLSEDAVKQRLSRGRQALKQGVSELVEQTLESSRPSKAFTVAVLGLVGAAAAPGSSGAASAAAATRGSAGSGVAAGASKLVWLGLSVAGLLAVFTGVAVMRSSSSTSQPGDAPPAASSKADKAILAALHQKRQAAVAGAPEISCEFHGKVISRAGEPVSGARIALTRDSMQSSTLDPRAIRAEADGTWRYGPVPRGTYLLSISAPGHLPETRTERCESSGAYSIDAPLAPGGTRVYGTVTDVGGGPVSEVTIWLIPALGQSGAAITSRTDDEGVYDLSVHPDRYMMLVVHPDYVLDARPAVVAGESSREDFVVLPGATVEGTILDPRGEPVAGAKVTTGGLSWRHMSRTEWPLASLFGAMFPVESDSQGRYRLGGLPPGSAQIHARSAGLVSRTPAKADLAIAETQAGTDVVVEEGFKVSGFVVNEDDPREGMANVNVLVQPEGGFATPNFATTDATGYFQIAGLVPGSYRIFAGGAAAAPLVMEEIVTISDADISDVLVRAKVGAAVSGQISPSGRASVRLEPASYSRDAAGALSYAAASMARAEVDESGSFRFPSVADGAYVVVATTLESEGRAPVTVAGREVTGLSVEVSPLAGIKGQVIDDRGGPVAGALVAAKPRRALAPNAYVTQLHTRGRTGPDGRFEIRGLHPATYELRVFHERGQRAWGEAASDEPFEPRSVEISSGVTNVELSVTSEGKSVRGVVIDPDGAPVEDAWVEVKPHASRRAPAGYTKAPALTDGSGHFEVGGLFGDEFELQATGPRGKLRSAPFESAGEEPVTLQLAPLSKLVATIKRQGELAEDFDVRVSDGPSAVLGRAIEKKKGTFELPGLISGDYKVEVKAGDSYAQQIVSVGPDPTTSLELQLEPTASVRGRVLDEGGGPLRGARVVVFGVALRVERPVNPGGVEVRDDGSFEIGGLAAGRGRIMVRKSADDYEPVAFSEFDLKPGQVLDLGTLQRGKRPSLSDAPFVDKSEDLGIRFFTGTNPPTAEQLEELDSADDPRSLLEEDSARLWIATVATGSPAEDAGLRPGDAVLAVGRMQIGEDLPPYEAMISLSQRWRSKGRAVDWVIERGGRQLTLPVVVLP